MSANAPHPRTPHYGIRELVDATGIPRRTIRYYVQRELLPPPLGAGRGHYYLPLHLALLRQIRELQDRGFSLDAIRVRFTRLGVNDPAAVESERRAEERRRAVEERERATETAAERDTTVDAAPASGDDTALLAFGPPDLEDAPESPEEVAPEEVAPEEVSAEAGVAPPASLRIRVRSAGGARVPAQRVTKLLLAPGLELHVADGREAPTARQLARLAAAAREILSDRTGPPPGER